MIIKIVFDIGAGANVDSRVRAIDALNWGGPLQIFRDGYLCLPYLSLPYMELLTDPGVKGYIIGASNVLFRQKRNLADILIDVDNLTMQCYVNILTITFIINVIFLFREIM